MILWTPIWSGEQIGEFRAGKCKLAVLDMEWPLGQHRSSLSRWWRGIGRVSPGRYRLKDEWFATGKNQVEEEQQR